MRARLLEVYCDGSGDARVGCPGGWAFVVVRDGEVLASGQGRKAKTTSLVMELEAARAALSEVVARGWHTTHTVRLLSDSSIALDVAMGRFRPRPKALHPLSDALRAVALTAQVEAKWVRAHAGHAWNEHVDALALAAKQSKR